MDARELAEKFHEAYERLAPQFGYTTRTETRQFDPASANGRLMIAVIEEVCGPTLKLLAAAEGGEWTSDGLRMSADEADAGHIRPTHDEWAKLLRAHAAALEEIERLKGERDAAFAMSKCECESTECCANLVKAQERAEKAECRTERLKVHAEEMADAIQFGDLAILTVAKAAAESYRAFDDGSPLTPHGEAIAAGDGTLHGAIDYWQERATQLLGESRVLADILRDAGKVIKTIEGESTEEEESLWQLRYMIDMALSPYDAELLKRK